MEKPETFLEMVRSQGQVFRWNKLSLHSYVSSHNLEDLFLVYPSICIICCMLQNTICVLWSALVEVTLVLFLAGHSEAFRFFHKVKSQKLLSLNHVLIFYAFL